MFWYNDNCCKYALIAQLDRVFGYEPKGRGFESLWAYQKYGHHFDVRIFVYILTIVEQLRRVADVSLWAYQKRDSNTESAENNPDYNLN